jgi:hypothetical protein
VYTLSHDGVTRRDLNWSPNLESHIYIPQEQGGPIIPSGTGFLFRRLLLPGLWWRYSNPPPHRLATHWLSQSQTYVKTNGQSVSRPEIFITVNSGFVDVGRPLSREDGSVACNCSCRSRSYFATDGQSWCRAHSRTCDQILLPVVLTFIFRIYE